MSGCVDMCPTCTVLPGGLPSEPELAIWCPTPHTAGKLKALLGKHGPVTATSETMLRACVSAQALAAAADRLRASLSTVELEGCRALALPRGEAPSLDHLAEVTSLRSILVQAEGGWLLDLLREGRYTSHFQPLVDARAPDRILAHEALFRGHDLDGKPIPPSQIFKLAQDARVLFQLDLAARRSAITAAAAAGLDRRVFINFTPSAIYDPQFCLRSTVALVDKLGFAPHQIVFEVVESDDAGDPGHLRSILRYYRERGFKVALDDVGAGFSSLNLLHELKPDVVKLDVGLIRGIDQDRMKRMLASALIDAANAHGIETVAEGVETEAELACVQEAGVTLVQGYLLARPSARPPRHALQASLAAAA